MDEEKLEAGFKPRRETELTAELLRKLNRGIGYTKSASGQLFGRVRRPPPLRPLGRFHSGDYPS